MRLTRSVLSVMFFFSLLFHVGVAAAFLLNDSEQEPQNDKIMFVTLAKIEKTDTQLKARQKLQSKKYVLDDVGETKEPEKKAQKKKVEKVKKEVTPSKIAKTLLPKEAPAETKAVRHGAKKVNAPIVDPLIRASYEQAIVAWLERHKRYPKRAMRRGLQGEILLRLRIDQEGKVLLYRIERKSAHKILDDEVMNMVQRANPFPKVPEGIAKKDREFLIPITFDMNS